MTLNRFSDLLETTPASQPANRFSDMLTPNQILPNAADDDRQAQDVIALADQLELPMPTVEDVYPALKQDMEFYGRKFRRSKHPWAIVDPTDTQPTEADPTDFRLGVPEYIARMDSIDWAKRIPFSPAGFIEMNDLMGATLRLKSEDYDKAYAAEKKKLARLGLRIAGEIGQEVPLGLTEQTYAEQISTDPLRRADAALIEQWLLRRQEVNDRGLTFGAKVFDGASYLPAWMIEFMLTGGLAKLGSEAAQEIGVKTLQGYAKTQAGRAMLNVAGWTGGTITRATLGMPHRLGEQILNQKLHSIRLADDAIIDVNPQSWANSILKGYAAHLIEVGSESAGGTIVKGAAWTAKNTIGRLPFGRRLFTAAREAYLAMHSEPGAAAAFADRFFDAAKYDGLIGEIGEERLATILHAIVGTEDFGAGPQAGPLDRLKAGLEQDLKNLPVEATVLAVPGAVKAATQIPEYFNPDTATEHDVYDLLADVAALHATRAARTYRGDAAEPDLPTDRPSGKDVGAFRQLLHDWGIRSKDGYEPFSDKDFHEGFKFLQMPDDIRRTFPQFDPVYQVQRSREMQKQVLDENFATMTGPYFKLTTDERKAVDDALIEAERNPDGPPNTLGMNEQQRAGFMAIRETLNACGDMLIEEMRAAGVEEKAIQDFAHTIRNYIPHKWYGSYAVVVKDRLTHADRAAGVTRRPTLFMTAVPYTQRFAERTRLQRLYPNQDVTVVKRNDIEYDAFQEAPPWAVSRMVDLIQEKAGQRLSEQTQSGIGQHAVDVLRETLSDLYKSKGFGMHYIRRRNIPGYTEDLRRPLAEYVAGFSGYITKMRAMKQFSEALQAIHPQRTPKLYKYALDYIRYVTGESMEFSTLKHGLYAWYLFGNIKSASLNLTQNLMLGWPVLSRLTRMPLAKLMLAMGRTATGLLTSEEKNFIAGLEDQGFLDAQMTQEVSGWAGNAILQQIKGPIGKAVSYVDLFKHMESLNRRSMGVALYNAGITDFKEAAELIDEAHFRYSKGNRPTLARGFASPLMVFRSWNINYLTWLKNQIKAGELGPLARSLSAWILLGGARALPGFSILAGLYATLFDRDIEGDAREAMGATAGQILFRGLPSGANISFTGSVGMGDLIPTDLTSLGGVAAGIPERLQRVYRDVTTRQWARALEDAAPEALRNPLAARRLYAEGDRDRSGRMILDLDSMQQLKLTQAEAIRKALGFAPDRLRREWDIRDTLDVIHTQRQQLTSQWADLLVLADVSSDVAGMGEVLQEWERYNAKVRGRGREDLVIDADTLDRAINSRLRPLNVPPESEWNTEARIRGQYRKKQ